MTVIRYSRSSLQRTIRNRLAEARVDAVVHPWPKIQNFQAEAVKILEEIQRNVEATKDLTKVEALKMLSRLARPGQPAGASGALAGLRTAITSIGLDEYNYVVGIKEAERQVRAAIEAGQQVTGINGVTADSSGLTKAEAKYASLRRLSDAGVYELHLQKFWDMPL